jgi:ribosomal protein S12 methylthiotransferase accessory factor
MNPSQAPVNYAMTLMSTEASTGFFACLPDPEPDLEEALAYLQTHVRDTFMHRYVLGLVGRMSADRVQAFLNGAGSADPLHLALVREAAYENSHLAPLRLSADPSATLQPAEVSPLTTLRGLGRPDQEIHREWNRLLADNLNHHRLLPEPDQAPRPFPYSPEAVADPGGVYITQILSRQPHDSVASPPRPSAEETAGIALEKLKALDLLEGTEMRHEASLSPYGLLHKWRLAVTVNCGRHNYRLAGLQTAYGRGLTLANARASYAMEVVERCSSFASIDPDHVRGYVQEHRIYRGTRSALGQGALAPIDPNAFGVDVIYRDEPLHWIEGIRRTQSGDEPVLVPVQSVFLFSNLDEVDLYTGHGSTGLASGNTMTEAKLSALMELVERDGEATHPFHHSLCFQVEARDSKVGALLADYRERGIQFQFQDISPPYGIPCCKCFVTDMDGRICKGTAASLNGRRAVLSALTETPFPYPYGPPSGPGLLQLPELYFEDLPDYSSRDAARDLSLVEALLAANGLEPIYIDLTRKDIGLPVVRALLAGFALTADLDGAWRVHPRLFGNYLKLYEGSADRKMDGAR